MSAPKDIKDYLHLYLGCECIVYDSKLPVKLIGVQPEAAVVMSGTYKSDYGTPFLITIDIPGLVKPILRPLSDMTEEESAEIGWRWPMIGHITPDTLVNLKHIPVLLSKGFDLFGLIKTGLAIDATTLKQNV